MVTDMAMQGSMQWGAHALVFEDGRGWYTNFYQSCGDPPYNFLGHSSNGYKVTYCGGHGYKVLMRTACGSSPTDV